MLSGLFETHLKSNVQFWSIFWGAQEWHVGFVGPEEMNSSLWAPSELCPNSYKKNNATILKNSYKQNVEVKITNWDANKSIFICSLAKQKNISNFWGSSPRLIFAPITSKKKRHNIKFMINLAHRKKSRIKKMHVTWKGKIKWARQKKGYVNHYTSTVSHNLWANNVVSRNT